MAILKLVLVVHLIIYGFSALVGVICFVKDTSKWHNAEKKVEIIPSAERGLDDERTGDNRTGDGDNDSTRDGDGDNDNSSNYNW